MKRKIKLLVVLIERLATLLEEHAEIFFLERPFLWKETDEIEGIENLKERRDENDEAIKQTKKAIKELVRPIPEKAPKGEQSILL